MLWSGRRMLVSVGWPQPPWARQLQWPVHKRKVRECGAHVACRTGSVAVSVTPGLMAACSCARLWRNRTAERVPGQGQREAAPGLCGAACRGEVGDGREFVLMFQNFSNANSQLLWVLCFPNLGTNSPFSAKGKKHKETKEGKANQSAIGRIHSCSPHSFG